MDETETDVTGCRVDCPDKLVVVTAMAVAGMLPQDVTFALTP